ncbi:hypothetical protein [Flavobacterium algoritolerans]|uniref:Carboxypeptidase-like regulatory domain-containing protein n=1 Tax=Flavobacterium algoritolerans TaxID=3041254 RepID=A0ABT6V5V2_9FLAO|nr:hypothetical protein [Flavobacterium algoritolerans]MDI5893595.1 hypothetical protein [Flavobacterium algoritolerans]
MKLLRVKINRILRVVLFLMCQISFGQTAAEKLLHGKIRVDSAYISGINILNLVNEKTAVTNSDGEFLLWLKPIARLKKNNAYKIIQDEN